MQLEKRRRTQRPGKRLEASLNPRSEAFRIESSYSENCHNQNAFSINATTDGGVNISFLIDTGADISILPSTRFVPDETNHRKQLVSANNSAIRYIGQKTMSIIIPGFYNPFNWSFAVADVIRPIIGADFLAHYGISVSCAQRKIFQIDTKELSETQPVNISEIENYQQQITKMDQKQTKPNSEIQMKIETNGPPVAQRQRRLFGSKLEATKSEFKRLLNEGTIRPSKSEWASPLVVVKKKRRNLETMWRLPCP